MVYCATVNDQLEYIGVLRKLVRKYRLWYYQFEAFGLSVYAKSKIETHTNKNIFSGG